MQKSAYISNVLEQYTINVSCKSITQTESKAFYSLLFSNNDKIIVYTHSTPFLLNKGSYTVLPPENNAIAVSAAENGAELFVLHFTAENTKIQYFSQMVFSASREQLLILKKITTDIQSCRHMQDDFKGRAAKKILDEIMTASLNQFFLEGQRLLIYSQNIQSGHIKAQLQNQWERYNARNRHYIEISNNADFYRKKTSSSYEISEAEKIADFINQNYMSNITLDDIVRHFNFSKTYICRIFKNHFSKTILEYQNNLKMQAAKELLLKREYSITQISDIMNYSSVHYFSASFKNYYGISPRNFLLQNE